MDTEMQCTVCHVVFTVASTKPSGLCPTCGRCADPAQTRANTQAVIDNLTALRDTATDDTSVQFLQREIDRAERRRWRAEIDQTRAVQDVALATKESQP